MCIILYCIKESTNIGGSTPVFDEVVLSLSAMNKVISIDEISGIALCFVTFNHNVTVCATGILVCEAGCILESLSNVVGDKGFVMPLDLAAKGRYNI